MAISHAFAAVTSRATNGSCTLKTFSKNIAEVNRGPTGYSIIFTEPMVNAFYCVDVCLNAGDATHRFSGYNRVSLQQLFVTIFTAVGPAQLDADFSVEVWADNDGSIGA